MLVAILQVVGTIKWATLPAILHWVGQAEPRLSVTQITQLSWAATTHGGNARCRLVLVLTVWKLARSL